MRPRLLYASIGLMAGLINGLLGIGGGPILVPALVFACCLPEHEAHGTAVAAVLFTSAVSAAVYVAHGRLDLSLAGQVALGGVVGSYLGARLMPRLKAQVLRRLYAAFLAAAGLRMLLGG